MRSVAGATGSSYSLAAAATNDAGSYTVVITNAAGSIASTAATLTVLLPPTILTQPQSLTVNSGAAATFLVAAMAVPTPTYQWKFNGANLSGATTSTYVVASAQATNSGDFTVAVSNSAGAVTSAPAHLTVQSVVSKPLTLALPQWVNNTWSLQIAGPSQTNYVLWRSTDLVNWTPVQTNFSASGSLQLSDPKAPAGAGFYRATLSP